MRFSRLESSFRVRFEPYAELHLDYLPPGRISDNVVGLFYKRLGSIPRADNPQGSTVRGTATTCDFPGVNPSRCPPRGQATTPAFRGADRFPSVHAASQLVQGSAGRTAHAFRMSARRTSRHWIPPRGQIFTAHPEAGSCCWWLAWWDGEGVNKKVIAASTVRGTSSTSNFPGVKPSRCPPRGQATTPTFRGADRLPPVNVASGLRQSSAPRTLCKTSASKSNCPRGGQWDRIRVSAGRTGSRWIPRRRQIITDHLETGS